MRFTVKEGFRWDGTLKQAVPKGCAVKLASEFGCAVQLNEELCKEESSGFDSYP